MSALTAGLGRVWARHTDRRILVRDLRLLHDVLESTAFAGRYRLCGGLLLGWTRENRPLDGDADVDFFYDVGDADRFESAIPAIVGAGFERLYRFTNNDGVVTEHSFERHGIKFEFFRTFPVEGGRVRYFTYSPAEPLQMLAEIPGQEAVPFEFLGRRWLKPADHEAELEAMYGDWRVPDPSWSYLNERCVIERQTWHNTDFSWTG